MPSSLGLQRSASSAVQRRAGVATPPSRLRCSLHRIQHSLQHLSQHLHQHPLLHLHLHRHQLSGLFPLLSLLAQLTLGIVPQVLRANGQRPRRHGVAECTTEVAQLLCQPHQQQRLPLFLHQLCPQHHHRQQILTIAQRVGPIGWLVGASPRSSGVAEFMAKVAQTRVVVDVPPLQSHMIAMQVLPTGWQAGVLRRKRGAARTRARVAHPKVEVVLEMPFFGETG